MLWSKSNVALFILGHVSHYTIRGYPSLTKIYYTDLLRRSRWKVYHWHKRRLKTELCKCAVAVETRGEGVSIRVGSAEGN
jgi:hypothetical protein